MFDEDIKKPKNVFEWYCSWLCAYIGIIRTDLVIALHDIWRRYVTIKYYMCHRRPINYVVLVYAISNLTYVITVPCRAMVRTFVRVRIFLVVSENRFRSQRRWPQASVVRARVPIYILISVIIFVFLTSAMAGI